ncbi:hypothetical protein WJX72_006027 [[Myrmecia] bisecta]|uniref:Uncharacterized protein n=1 Tax=[Myrmecia] bisecta TaxID=41462 RepID=A0AAW1Q7D2_9CHLO
MSADARQHAKNECASLALQEGLKAAAWAGAVSGTLVAAAHTYWPGFRKSLGVSGKTALIVSPIFGMFFLQSELSMNECARKQRWQHSVHSPTTYTPAP